MNPRHDSHFPERVGELLICHYGEPVHVQAHIPGTDCWVIHQAVESLRDRGFVIEGSRGKAGYTLTGLERPRKARLRGACDRRWREMAMEVDS